MRLIEIRHQTKSAVKPAVNNKKTKHASSKQQQDQVSWCWVTLKTYLPIPVLAPASLACLHGCRVQKAVIRCRICEAAQRSAASLFLETALQSSAIILRDARESEFDENLIKEIEEHEAKPCSHCCYFRLPSAATERPTRGFVSYVGGYSWMRLKRHF